MPIASPPTPRCAGSCSSSPARSFLADRLASLATTQGLTVYDAAYLDLASRLAVPPATRDAQLIAAASRVGVELLPL